MYVSSIIVADLSCIRFNNQLFNGRRQEEWGGGDKRAVASPRILEFNYAFFLWWFWRKKKLNTKRKGNYFFGGGLSAPSIPSIKIFFKHVDVKNRIKRRFSKTKKKKQFALTPLLKSIEENYFWIFKIF